MFLFFYGLGCYMPQSGGGAEGSVKAEEREIREVSNHYHLFQRILNKTRNIKIQHYVQVSSTE